jgi:DNA repair photolyase
MHTRSHLMLQDIDLLRAFGERLVVGISLPTDDDSIRQEFEPNAPSIMRRLELMKTLSENGIAVYASISPLLPCDPDRLVQSIAPFTSRVWVDTMNWLEVMRSPELLQKYKLFFESETYERLAVQIAKKFESQKENRETIFSKSNLKSTPAPVRKAKQLTLTFGSTSI